MRHAALFATLVAAAALEPSLAVAHVGVGDANGFAHGFGHPVSGADHVAAMVMVGVFAAQLGGRAVWIVPAAFVTAMALGGALGMAGVAVPLVEVGIALSLVVLGAVVAFGVRAPLAVAAGLVGLFAIFHGYAHGVEAPETAEGVAYAAGFMIVTALLHAAGVGFGLAMSRIEGERGRWIVKGAGAAVALLGLVILGGAA